MSSTATDDGLIISIVIPAYNAERFLDATLASIVAQTERRWECVVVDDGSTDATAEIARAWAERDPRIMFLRKDNGGTSAARNTGYRATSSATRFVTFMDSDDVYLPRALEVLVAAAERRAVIGSHGLAEMIDAEGRPIDEGAYAQRGRSRMGLFGRRLVEWPLDEPTDFRVLVNGNVLFPPGLVLVRREAYEAVGPFDEAFSGPEDWDMLIRLSRLGPIAFVDEVLLLYRRHESNLGAAPGIERQAWAVRCKAFHSPENSPEQRRIAQLGWRAYQRQLAWERARAAIDSIRQRQLLTAGKSAVRAVAAIGRYARGHPTPRIVRPSGSWPK